MSPSSLVDLSPLLSLAMLGLVAQPVAAAQLPVPARAAPAVAHASPVIYDSHAGDA